MSTIAPPPPPPTPIEHSKTTETAQPSFLQNFIAQNSQRDPSKSKQTKYTNAYLSSQCLIPTSTPEQALPDIKPLLSLSESELNKDVEPLEQGEFRTALQDFREALLLCANYQQTSDINRQIFQFKTKRWKLNKAKKDAESVAQAEIIDKKLNELEEPPYNEEYSDLKIMQNYTLAGIHAANHRMCLAHAVCPQQTHLLKICYDALDSRVGQALAKQGLGKVICMEERDAVERCVGNGVQRVVQEALS